MTECPNRVLKQLETANAYSVTEFSSLVSMILQIQQVSSNLYHEPDKHKRENY